MIRLLEVDDEGNKIPFKFGFYAQREFQNETGINAIALEREFTLAEVESLAWNCYVNGCNAGKSEGWKVKYTRDDLVLFMDHIYFPFVNLMPLLTDDYLVANKFKKKSDHLENRTSKKPAPKKPAKKAQV